MKNKINETASSGSTTSGSIASVNTGFNFPLISRVPKPNFGYSEYKPKGKRKTKK